MITKKGGLLKLYRNKIPRKFENKQATSQSITSFSAARFCACLKMFHSNFLGTRCILYLPTCINRHHEEICIDRITNAQKIQGRDLFNHPSNLSLLPNKRPPTLLMPLHFVPLSPLPNLS